MDRMVIVENTTTEDAPSVPVSAGMPFGRGTLLEPTVLSLARGQDELIPVQAQCLSRWPDGSCRWVLLDFQCSAAPEGSVRYVLSTSGENPVPKRPVTVKEAASEVCLSNDLIVLEARIGSRCAVLVTGEAATKAQIVSILELGDTANRITSETIIDSTEVYARGPLRAAVSLIGRRVYSDGSEGPWSQRIEMFADSPFVRVEDTFVYAHTPGTHAEPENPLGLWAVETLTAGEGRRLEVESLVYDEEAEELIVSSSRVAFWGRTEPFDLSRHTDEDLFGEDCPGMALGLAKSCALLIGLVRTDAEREPPPRPMRGIWAHTTPQVYAESGALGYFAAAVPGEFEKAEEGIRQVLGFWMWFQDNDPKGVFNRGAWHGLFDWGDWQCRHSDVNGDPTGWLYHDGRYGWDCNEMDTTLMLWSAFCHTARPEYWRAAVAMSRHVMDVDMCNVDYRRYVLPAWVYDHHRYDAPWREGVDRLKDKNTVGLGRRHNVQHWGNGIGDTRHTWNGGILMYYYLSGNRRAYDAVLMMADMHMQRLYGYACGEYTLAFWCLYNAWQLTGDRKYLDEFTYRLKIVSQLQYPDGSIPLTIDFDEKSDYPEANDRKPGGAGLAFDYMSNALVDYHFDTHDRTAEDVLLGLCSWLADEDIRYGQTYQPVDRMKGFCWAYMQTREEHYLEHIRYYLSSLEAEPPRRAPVTAEEWVECTYEVMRQQAWRIRHIGPGVRMAPYAMHTIGKAEEGERCDSFS